MTRTVDPALLDRPWRVSAAWDLVPVDRAAQAEQALLAQLGDDPTLFGLLRPVGEPAGRTLRAVDRDTALLWWTLAAFPGPIPGYARRPDPGAAAAGLAALLLDGLFEIRGEDGSFRTGGAALALVDGRPALASAGVLPRLSREALEHAAALAPSSAAELAGILYGYGRVALAPGFVRELGSELEDGRAVLDWLGLGGGGARRRALEAHWRVPTDTREGWLAFDRRAGTERPNVPHGPTWKLYFSPRIAALPETLESFASTLARHGAQAFKLGAELAGLTRPDKAVAYFARFEDLAAAGQELAERLADVPAQGVPFTAPFDSAALVSWGVDPPDTETLPWWGRQSWRLWLAQRLAAVLATAPGSAAERVDLALARLRLDGLDVERWTPSLALWHNADRSPS